jgi:hypothetical protein
MPQLKRTRASTATKRNARLIKYDVTNVSPFDPNDKHMPFPLTELTDEQAEAIRARLDRYRYPLYSADELGAFPPVEWLIDHRLAAGELTCLWGKGDSFKSFTALGWSCQLVAAGHTVIYIAAEGASGLRVRVAAWMKRHGVEELAGLYVLPSNVNIHRRADVAAWLREVREQLKGLEPSLVVIDTLARNFVGGDENSARDFGEFVEGCESIRRELKSAVLVIHHSGKDGKVERGTESLRNASFAMFHLKKKGGSGTLATFECDRMKEAEQPPTTDLRFRLVELPELGEDVSSLALVDSTAAESKSAAESAAKYSAAQRKLIRAASRPNGRPNEGLSKADVCRALKCRDSKATAVTKSLIDAGILAAEGATKNRRFRLTETGAREAERL